jgi:hypothetical protein
VSYHNTTRHHKAEYLGLVDVIVLYLARLILQDLLRDDKVHDVKMRLALTLGGL